MKRHLVILSGLAALFGAATAEAADFRGGVEGGINLSNASISLGTTTLPVTIDNRTGFIGGLFGELGLVEFLHFRPELLFAQKGFKIGTITFEESYLELPLLAEAKFKADKLSPFFFFGPNVGFKLGANASDASGSRSTSDATETIDFALDMGAGVELAIDDTWAAQFNGRYSLGLTDTDKGPSDVKNRGFQFMLGVSRGF